jgi:murein L,D-transpeptidase YafK
MRWGWQGKSLMHFRHWKTKLKKGGLVLLPIMTIGLVGLAMTLPGTWQRAKDDYSLSQRYFNQARHYVGGLPPFGTPDAKTLSARLDSKGLKRGQPIFIRIFKSELTLELWMRQGERFVLFERYPICFLSGGLGPKVKQGDAQAPEGFYRVSREQMKPDSKYHRAFNLGYPNAYDRAHGRTGAFLMVHGACVSIGCYAMTNGVMDELWDLINAAFDGGQSHFAVHVFPFPLTEARLAAYSGHRWAEFWRQLKPGYDAFEAKRLPPRISLCKGSYVVDASDADRLGAGLLRQNCP